MSREKNIYKTMLMNIILQIINFSYKFIITPFLLSIWGGLKYGEWLTLFSFISSVSLLNFGIAKYYGNNLRKSYIKKDFEEYKTIFLESIFLVFMVFILIAVGLYILIDKVELQSMLNLYNWPYDDIKLSVLLLGLSIAGNIFLELVSYFYVSIGQYSVKPLLSSLTLLSQLLLIVVFTYFNVGIVTISAIIFGTVIVTAIISLGVFIIKFRYLIPNHFNLNFNNIVISIKESNFFQLITFSQFFVLQGSVLIIANQLGALSVSLFVITRTITSGLGRQLAQVVNHSIWPELTTLFAEKNYKKLRELHYILSKISMILITFFILFISDIMHLWLSTDEYLDYPLIGLLLFYLLSLYIWIPSSFILMSDNHVKLFGKLSILSTIVFLLFSFYLLPEIGIHGVVTIMITVDILFMGYLIPKTACDKINTRSKDFFLQIFKLVIPALSIFFIFFIWIIDFIQTSSMGEKILLLLVGGTSLAVYFSIFCITTDEKMYILKKVIRKKL